MTTKQWVKVTLGRLAAKRYGYDIKYLRGRWFSEENNFIGWNWVIRDGKSCRREQVNRGCPFPISVGSRVVGAGAVVTKSFPKGFCVIAGNPAKIIKCRRTET